MAPTPSRWTPTSPPTTSSSSITTSRSTTPPTSDSRRPSRPWDVTSNNRIWDNTLADLKKLDAAYKFSPGKGEYGYSAADPHPFRGIATGDVPAPAGYTANDFRIPTFQEVLAALPAGTKINIDIKDQGSDPANVHGIAAAQKLAAILQAQPGGDNENVMVASFGSEQIDAFHAAMPGHDSISGSLPETAAVRAAARRRERPVRARDPGDPASRQVRPRRRRHRRRAGDHQAVVDSRGDDYAIHVWGADGTVENDALYTRMVAAKVQGFFPQESTKLAAFLCANHVPDATGAPRCTPPNPVGPIGSLGKAKAKGKAKAGKAVKVNGSVTNSGDQPMTNVRVCVDIPKKLKKVLKAKCVNVGDVAPGATVDFTIKVKSSKKAKGKYKLGLSVTSDNGGLQQGTVKVKYSAKQGKTGSAK